MVRHADTEMTVMKEEVFYSVAQKRETKREVQEQSGLLGILFEQRKAEGAECGRLLVPGWPWDPPWCGAAAERSAVRARCYLWNRGMIDPAPSREGWLGPAALGSAG